MKSTRTGYPAAVTATGASELGPRRKRDESPLSRIKIVLAEDHVFVRELVGAMLAKEPRYEIIAEVSSAEEALAVCQERCPDLLVLDINLPGLSGLEAIPRFQELCPKTRVLVCSGSVSEAGIVAALRTGAHGFMEKTDNRANFLEAVRRVSAGERYFCARSSRLLSEIAQGRHDDPRPGPAKGSGESVLTPREKEVLALVATGHVSKEIGARLHLSVHTVDTHRVNLMRKTGARNAADLTRYALRHGIVPLA